MTAAERLYPNRLDFCIAIIATFSIHLFSLSLITLINLKTEEPKINAPIIINLSSPIKKINTSIKETIDKTNNINNSSNKPEPPIKNFPQKPNIINKPESYQLNDVDIPHQPNFKRDNISNIIKSISPKQNIIPELNSLKPIMPNSISENNITLKSEMIEKPIQDLSEDLSNQPIKNDITSSDNFIYEKESEIIQNQEELGKEISTYNENLYKNIVTTALNSYPSKAIIRKKEGIAFVRIVIFSNGNIKEVTIVNKNELPNILVKAAIKAVIDASPFEPIPEQNLKEKTFNININYKLNN